MGNWKYMGKGKIICPNCQAEIDCEVRLKASPKRKMR